MLNKLLNNKKTIILLAGSLILGACGGGGGSDSTGDTTRIEQNAVYINAANKNVIMAARDDGSISPFGLVTVNGANPFALLASPDSLHVAYKISTPSGTTNLYVIHANGAYNTQVTDLPSGRDVTDVVWSPEGDRLVYLADANTAGKQELFMTTVAFDSASDISARNIIISGTVNGAGLAIDEPKWSLDGTKVAYLVTNRSRTTTNKVVGLNYHDTRPRTAARNSVRLSIPSSFPSYQDITDYTWSADGTRLAYLSNPLNDGREYLYQVNFSAASLTPSVTAPAAGYSVTDVAYAADSRAMASIRYNSNTRQSRLKIDDVVTNSETFKLDTADRIRSMKWANQIPVLAYQIKNDNTGDYSLKMVDLDRDIYDVFLHNADMTGENVNSYNWSHDGDRIVLKVAPFNTVSGRLDVHTLLSGTVQRVTGLTNNRFISNVRWSQDDQRIAFSSAEPGCRNGQIHSTSSVSVDVIDLDSFRCTGGFVY